MSLMDNWKKVGKDFKHMGNDSVKNLGKDIGKTAKDFGKTMVKTVQYSAEKVGDWANIEDEANENEHGAETNDK